MPVNRFETPPGDAPETATDDEAQRGGPEAIERLQGQFEELGEYARLYVSARADALLAAIRACGLWLVAGLVALVVLIALLSAAAVIGILGVADLVGQALGDRTWAGFVVTGFGFLAICFVGFMTAILVLRRRFRNKTVNKYAKQHAEQRARFGRDVTGRAARQTERS